MKKLTIAEIKFCELIAAGASGEDAHEAAYGYRMTTHGYSNATRKLAQPYIQQRILEIRMGLQKAAKIDRERLLEEMAAIAFANIADYLTHDGESVTIKPMGELTRAQARAIKNVTCDKGRISLEFHDKIAATRQICTMLGIGAGDISLTQNNFVIRSPEVVKNSHDFEAMAQRFIEIEAHKPPQPDSDK
jgi:phage terminase small subunit